MRHARLALTIGLLASVVLCGQEYLKAPRFPRTAYFRRHFIEQSPHIELRAPRNLKDFIVGGALQLSLRSYLELVLSNNTGIEIQRLSIEPQRNDIMRAFG